MNEDAIISEQGVTNTLQYIIDESRGRLKFYEDALLESCDFDGKSHRAYVKAVAGNIRQHLDQAERYLKKQKETT